MEQHLLAGQVVPAEGSREVRGTNPSTGQPGTALIAATREEVAAAVATADVARGVWRRTPPAQRAAALQEAARVVRADAQHLGEVLSAETGRLLGEARGSAEVAADLLAEAAVTGLLAAGRNLAGDPGAVDVVRREPRGVVAVLTPWNDPYPAAAGLLAAALVMGNTVVHKPSERSAAAGWELAVRISQCLPDGVLNVLTGDGAVGAAVAADPRVHVVAQVGSTTTGRAIAATVGARGGRVLLENGGKDPILVDAGVNPRWAAQQIATGAFTNAGQLCTSVERVYLHSDVSDAVISALLAIAETMVVGDPADPASDLGPMVDERQLQVVAEQVDAAVAAGAQCLTGGARLDRPGSWYPPTVLTGCTPDMAVLTEETFGPVAAIVVVADFEEGLELAEAGAHGLAATVLTPRMDHALRAAEHLEVGTVKVNAVFGGAPGGSADPRRASGSGPGFGPALLGELSALKAVHLEPAPPA
ncbi:aldehyde dehydrogenase family protein [Rhodococcus sp. X156]|uniref:aldehyde dehydrogenase family protein n=1 Tax=Rhodococcus sp. X156 TaxID=2499145 RepID=UPI001F495608|nr:aldehyde dehydrogenase family protein [Rhodococcus sp. X156]